MATTLKKLVNYEAKETHNRGRKRGPDAGCDRSLRKLLRAFLSIFILAFGVESIENM